MNRRSTIKYLATGGLVAAIGGSYYWLSKDRDHSGLSVSSMLARLRSLELNSIQTSGAWDAPRTFNHLAQSIEFSMNGFPEMKSALFRNTAGKLAFSVFQASGRMTHGLDEPIPGETIISDQSDTAVSIRRLVTALERFESFDGQLMPHFAYGELTHREYSIAHVMHINNHFEQMLESKV